MKNFFERDHDEHYDSDYVPSMRRKFSVDNLSSLSKKQIIDFYEYKNDKNFLAYRFDLLKQWMKQNERFIKSYTIELEEIIDKLCLEQELNSFERQYIIDVNAIVFAKVRNLKQLIVDFSINDKELVFYRYEIDKFNEIKNNNETNVLHTCDFYITTQRIIISKQIDIISITYDQIKNFEFRKDKITFILKNGKKYCIRCSNTYVIYVSLERVLKREKIVFNK